VTKENQTMTPRTQGPTSSRPERLGMPRWAVLGVTLLVVLVSAANAASAQAAPEWRVDPLATTTAAPGGTLQYQVQLSNAGDASLEASLEPWTFTATLPTGLTAISAESLLSSWDCSSFTATLTCEDTTDTLPAKGFTSVLVEVEVDSNASGILTSEFAVSGGADAASQVDPTTITPVLPGFGIDAFAEEATADAAGTPSTQAAGRPYSVTTSIDFNTVRSSAPLKGTPYPTEAVRDVLVDLPPGLLGNPAGLAQCSLPDLANGQLLTEEPLCPVESQVGTTLLHVNFLDIGTTAGPFPVYNMSPPADHPARFGFVAFGSVVLIDAKPRSSGDYGFTAEVRNISEGLGIASTSLTLWGVPADPIHTPERDCPGEKLPAGLGPTCASPAPQRAFWRNPTSCQAAAAGLTTTVRADSWVHPGVFDQRTTHSHLPKGYPYPEADWGVPQGPTGCSKVRFEPQLEAAPTTNAADSPSGLDVHLRVPQDCWDQKEGLCQSDLRDSEVTLPQGMTLNPSSAAVLGACSSRQIGLITPLGASPIHFDEAAPSCPDNSKIGKVTIATPLLGRHGADGQPVTDADGNIVPEPLTGSVYLAKQGDNPFGSLLAMYLVAEGSGVIVKQAGEIVTGPGGRLTTVFKDAPQQPFSDLEVSLFGGPRAPLRTPPTCGSFATTARLTPWSGNGAVTRGSGFEIANCPNSGFDPKLTAGTQNPLAGKTSPFTLRLTREDGTQELAGLSATLPPGLTGYLKGIAYCPDSTLAAISGDLGTGAAQEASPACSAASRVGKVTVGAGAGPNPFYTQSGRAYLAGPYKGAPLSLAVVAPAVAGPFDLGNVVVRNALRVNPETAQITAVADPLPTALHGIPLDLRDVRVDLNRPDFTLNPTSCDPMAIDATLTSAQGASANRSDRFQVAGCDRLGFKPKLTLKLKGAVKRSDHPALTAVLAARRGDANIGRVQVALPHSEFLAQSHIKTICTRMQFAAGACPPGSIYGTVTATSPIIDYPLTGNVYLRSSDNPLPDMVLALHGPATQPLEVDAVGRIDSINGGIRTTFATVPDAPLTKVTLRMQGGKKGLLENSRNICRSLNRASVEMDGQNGKVGDSRPPLQADCPKQSRKARGHR
jgi:uncharacterized repeat protein (TIGR01451 family)